MENKRQYGLDVLRIVSMLLITAIHYLAYSGIMQDSSITVYNKALLSMVGGMSVAAVNVFVLITGYFSCEKKLNIKRILTLWIQVLFTGIVLTVVANVFLKQPIGLTTLLKTIFPLITMHYWFLTMYVVLMLVSPLVNLFLSCVTEKQHKVMCIVGFFVICVFFVSNPFIDEKYYIAYSRGLIWLVYLYIVGACIKKYGAVSIKRKTLLVTFLIYVIVCILKFFQIDNVGNCNLLDGNGVLPFLLSLFLFVLFKDLNCKGDCLRKLLSQLSSCAFLVYILQEHTALRQWYWNLFSIKSYASSPWMIVNMLTSLLALWPVALLLQRLFECVMPFVNFAYTKLSCVVNKYFQNIKRSNNVKKPSEYI